MGRTGSKELTLVIIELYLSHFSCTLKAVGAKALQFHHSDDRVRQLTQQEP
jgi:hypothetical protein